MAAHADGGHQTPHRVGYDVQMLIWTLSGYHSHEENKIINIVIETMNPSGL
jgi:hypothetical protein